MSAATLREMLAGCKENIEKKERDILAARKAYVYMMQLESVLGISEDMRGNPYWERAQEQVGNVIALIKQAQADLNMLKNCEQQLEIQLEDLKDTRRRD